MRRSNIALIGLAIAAATVTLAATPAQAAPNCVAQSIATEHQAFGTGWGHDLVAFLATHPELLEEFGFRSYGALASFAAVQDRIVCPPDL